MKPWPLAILLMLLTGFLNSAYATERESNVGLTLGQYRAARQSGGAVWEQVSLIITVAGNTVGWVDQVLLSEKREELTCPPPNLPLNRELFISTLDKYLAFAGRHNIEWQDSTPVIAILIGALRQEFPCSSPSSR